MIENKVKKPRIKQYVFSMNIAEIRSQNLTFGISYKVDNEAEIYTDFLKYYEVEKPQSRNIEIQKIFIIKNEKVQIEFQKKDALKIVALLDFHNKKRTNFKK